MTKTLRKKFVYILLFIAAACCFFIACASATVYAPKEIEMYLGDQAALGAVVIPFGSEEGVTYNSSNPSVAGISAEGVITALSAGETEITSKISGGTAKTKVRVYVPAEEVIVDESPMYVTFEDRKALREVETLPEGSKAVIEWEIENEEIAQLKNIYTGNGREWRIEGIMPGATLMIGTDVRTGEQVCYYPIVVLDREVLKALSPEEGLTLYTISVINLNEYVIGAKLTDNNRYINYLEEYPGAVAETGHKTWYFSSDPEESPVNSDVFGIKAVLRGGEETSSIYVYKQFPLDVVIDQEHYLHDDVQVWRIEASGDIFRTMGVSEKSQDELFEILFQSSGFWLEGVYVIEQRGELWCFVITIEEKNGLNFIETEISRFLT